MIGSRIRLFATLAPKPTSKKTKSCHQLSPGMPTIRLTRRQTRMPSFNHVLRANEDLSRRERHFRRCLIQAQCAAIPHNPDLTTFVAPYWLYTAPTTSAAAGDPSSSNRINADRSRSEKSLMPGLYDPIVQSVANTRIMNALAARADETLRRQLMHSGVLAERDIQEVDEMIRRRQCPTYVPLIDRVLMDCERSMGDQMSAVDGQSVKIYQHLISALEIDSILSLPPSGQQTDKSHQRNDQNRGDEDNGDEGNALLVQRIVGLATANARERVKYLRQEVMKAFRRHSEDCGSVQVQAAVLTLQMRNMIRHVYRFPQDTPSRVRIDYLTHQRRKMLDSLRKTNFSSYMRLCKDLGLKFA